MLKSVKNAKTLHENILYVILLVLALSPLASSLSPDGFVKELIGQGQENELNKFITQQSSEQKISYTSAESTIQLQVVPYGNGLGSINSLDGKIKSCTRIDTLGCFADYPANTNVTLIVNPGLSTTISFSSPPGQECTPISANSCNVTLNNSKMVAIKFNSPTSPAFETYIAYPYSQQIIPVYGTLTIKAELINDLYTLANVSFSVLKKGSSNTKTIGFDKTSPYTVNWIPLETGEYEIRSHLFSTDGWTASSPAVTVSVNESSLIPQCIDGDDGNKPFTKSNMTSFGYTYVDNCLNTNSLIEFFCDQDMPSGRLVACDLGCSQGACIPFVPQIKTKVENTWMLGWFSADEDPEFFHGLDSSANGKHLSAKGNISIFVEEDNPSYLFNGDSYAEMSFASFPFNYPNTKKEYDAKAYNVSISLWFNTNATSGVILGQSPVLPPTIPIEGALPAIYIGYDGKLRTSLFWDNFGAGDNPASGRYISKDNVNDSLWHNVAITYSNRTERVYLDGKEVNIREFTQEPYSSEYFYTLGTGWALGWDPFASSTGWLNYKGKIDKVSIYGYSRTLSSSDVEQLYNEGRAGVSPPVPLPPQPPVQPPASGGGSAGGGGGGSAGGGGGSSSGGGGGGVTILPKVWLINSTQLEPGYTQILKEGDKISFAINNESHSVTLLKINKNLKEGYFEIKSESQYVFLKANESSKFDLTNDTFLDLSLKVNSLSDSVVNVTIKSINEPKEIPKSPITGSAISDTFSKKSENNFLVWIVIAAVIIILYFLTKSSIRPKKQR